MMSNAAHIRHIHPAKGRPVMVVRGSIPKPQCEIIKHSEPVVAKSKPCATPIADEVSFALCGRPVAFPKFWIGG